MPITDEHVDHWLDHGHAIIPELFDAATLEPAREEALRYFPTFADFAANRPRYDHLVSGLAMREFPYAGTALNLLSVHPDLLDFAERITGLHELHMTAGVLWAKYPGGQDFEQPLHSDHHNNDLLWPRDDPPYRVLSFIIYLDDVTADLGPTHVLSKQVEDLSAGYGFRMREERPELYEQETPVIVPAGSVFVQSFRSLHRGSRLLTTEARRLSLHVAFRPARMEWQGFQVFGQAGNTPEMGEFMAAASPRQRRVLGVPLPGDPYWTEETVMRVGERYPGMDMSPYAAAVSRV